MKNATLILCLFAFSTYTFAQQELTDKEIAANDLMKKYWKEKNTANGLIILGIAVGASGWIIATSDFISDTGLFEDPDLTGIGVMFVGVVCVGVGIEFHITAGKTRKEASELSVLAGYDRTSPFALGNHRPVYYPAVKIRLRIQ